MAAQCIEIWSSDRKSRSGLGIFVLLLYRRHRRAHAIAHLKPGFEMGNRPPKLVHRAPASILAVGGGARAGSPPAYSSCVRVALRLRALRFK